MQQPADMQQPVRLPPPYASPSPRPGTALRARVEAVPGTPFGLAIPEVRPVTSGPAVGALVAGIGSLLVTGAELCFGLLAAQAGAGALVGGAFAILAGLVGVAGVALGVVGLRQIRRAGAGQPGARVTGRGMAIGGVACGGAGAALAVLILLILFFSS